MNEPKLFATWLWQGDSNLTGRDVSRIPAFMVSDLNNDDVLAVMYHGNESQALEALQVLKYRFDEEMNYMSDNQHYAHPHAEL
jgi:hypothetical protein